MQIASIRPSTVDGIKQLAKKIKRERNTSHTEALNLASRQAGTGLSKNMGRASESHFDCAPQNVTTTVTWTCRPTEVPCLCRWTPLGEDPVRGCS